VGVGEAAQRAAAGELAVDVGEQKLAGRRRVVTRQRGDLVLEILEAEVDVEAGPVLAKDRRGAGELRLRGRPAQLDPGRFRTSPCRHTSHPPFFPCPSTRDNNRKADPAARLAGDATICAPEPLCAPAELHGTLTMLSFSSAPVRRLGALAALVSLVVGLPAQAADEPDTGGIFTAPGYPLGTPVRNAIPGVAPLPGPGSNAPSGQGTGRPPANGNAGPRTASDPNDAFPRRVEPAPAPKPNEFQ